MNKLPVAGDSTVATRTLHRSSQVRVIGFVLFLALLMVLLCRPLLSLVSYALHSDLNSYTVLVPFISGYLLYILRHQLPKTYCSSISWALLPLACGIVLLISALTSNNFQPTLTALYFVCFVVSGGFFFLGKTWMSAAAFPFAFLLFMTPLPDPMADWMEEGSKLASAESANFFLQLTGTPILRDGVVFQLPGIAIEVAQECSGIRSSWVLLIASTLAAYLFLRRSSHRAVLVFAAIPLGILRNGFRITVIGLLCVYLGPQMIHSPIHRQGGPLFFALSLIPLFLVLWLLKKNEKARELKKIPPD
jgi:exosortase C (VPDSG-CTERM-specific)